MRAAPNPLFTLLSIRRHARASKEELARFQGDHLRRVIRHAYERVPYYRRLFDSHRISPEAIRTADDLVRIPVTTRKTLQELSIEEIVAKGVHVEHLKTYSTSGWSGIPIRVRRTWIEDRLLATIRMRAMHTFGLRPGDDVTIVKSGTASGHAGSGFANRVLRFLRKDRWQVVDCNLSCKEVMSRLEGLRPAVVVGYPGHLTRMCEVIGAHRLRNLELRFVRTGGEVLTAVQRSQIADGFGAPVYDAYGSYEFDLLAWECPHTGGFHVCDDGLILEVVRGGLPAAVGEQGETVGTCLHSYAMPLMRYALGDVVERGLASCPCGAAFSTIRNVIGRVVDFFELPDGRHVHPYGVFIPIRERSPWMRQFQVTQIQPDRVVMQVVGMPPGPEALAVVREMAAAKLGPDVRFEIEMVADIPAQPSGKFQMYRSFVRPSSAPRS